MNYLAKELATTLDEESLFTQVAKLEGETFRDVAGRKTFRVELNGKPYFAKVHFGIGWKEIFKNLLQLRLPVLGAENEWRAIQKLENLNVETMKVVAYAREGSNPARIHSCIVTEALEETLSLEDLVLNGQLTLNLKRELVIRLAKTSRTLHDNGVNHRDYYLCHFLLSLDSLTSDTIKRLHLIDLHRVQIRDSRTPSRWVEKDLAGLLFSAADAGLTQRDLYRFIKTYSDKSLREALKEDGGFWRTVVNKASRLYKKDQGTPSDFLASLGS